MGIIPPTGIAPITVVHQVAFKREEEGRHPPLHAAQPAVKRRAACGTANHPRALAPRQLAGHSIPRRGAHPSPSNRCGSWPTTRKGLDHEGHERARKTRKGSRPGGAPFAPFVLFACFVVQTLTLYFVGVSVWLEAFRVKDFECEPLTSRIILDRGGMAYNGAAVRGGRAGAGGDREPGAAARVRGDGTAAGPGANWSHDFVKRWIEPAKGGGWSRHRGTRSSCRCQDVDVNARGCPRWVASCRVRPTLCRFRARFVSLSPK